MMVKGMDRMQDGKLGVCVSGEVTESPTLAHKVCQGRTKSGKPCGVPPLINRPWCFVHDPSRVELNQEARRRGAAVSNNPRRRKVLPADTPLPKLETNRELRDFVVAVVHDVRCGRLDPKIGGILTGLLNVLARVVDAVALSDEVAELREAASRLPKERADEVLAASDSLVAEHDARH